MARAQVLSKKRISGSRSTETKNETSKVREMRRKAHRYDVLILGDILSGQLSLDFRRPCLNLVF